MEPDTKIKKAEDSENNPVVIKKDGMSEQQVKEAERRHSFLYPGTKLYIPECCKQKNVT